MSHESMVVIRHGQELDAKFVRFEDGNPDKPVLTPATGMAQRFDNAQEARAYCDRHGLGNYAIVPVSELAGQ